MKIPLLSFILGAFIIHQPLIVVLRLLDAEVAINGVHGNKRLIQSLVQPLYSLTQFRILLDNQLRLFRL